MNISFPLGAQQIVAARVAFMFHIIRKTVYSIFVFNHLSFVQFFMLTIYCPVSEGCQTKLNAPLHMKDVTRKCFITRKRG